MSASQTPATRVLVAVTGGIAAYRAADLVRELRRAGFDVTALLTRGAREFVGAQTFAALTGRDVLVDGAGAEAGFAHLDAGVAADVLVVAPATAHTLARFAQGIADDLLTNVHLGFAGPVVVAPAMNTRMWQHPATQANIALLKARGVHVVPPGFGELACGDVGAGRLADIDSIVAAVQVAASSPAGGGDVLRALAGRRVVVTAGGTSEPIDSVRTITNRSSGRMGLALARAAARAGADVHLIVTTSVDAALYRSMPRASVVETAAQLEQAVGAAADEADVVIMAAAVSDYTVAGQPADRGKLAREGEGVTLTLVPTNDILAGLGARRAALEAHRPLLVGFAAEVGVEGLERARDKRVRKRVDVIVHNDVSRDDIGFSSDDNEVTIIAEAGELHVPRASKDLVAVRILEQVAPLLTASGEVPAAQE